MIDYSAFSKTMLHIFNSIALLTERIDKSVNNIAMGGSNFYYGDNMTIDNIFNKITDLTNKKNLLINLRLHTIQILKNLELPLRKILLLKYKERLQADKAAELLEISTRTFFRQHDKAILSFACFLKSGKLKENEILECLDSEPWINETYKKYCGEIENENFDNNSTLSTNLLIDKLLDLTSKKDNGVFYLAK